MALTKDRNTRRRDGELVYFPLKAAAVAFAGGIAVSDAGYAKPGEAAAGLLMLGRFEEGKSNAGGADGAVTALVRRKGAFLWGNSGTDPVDATHVGGPCYIEDDETVAATDDDGGLSPAGVVIAVGSDGVWVDIDSIPGAETGLGRVLYGEVQSDASNIAANAARDIAINNVAGAAVGDAVAVAPPAGIDDGLAVVGFVSAADTVTVRLINTTNAGIDPPAATYKVAVFKA